MNKTSFLLFRGQSKDREPTPTLMRERWAHPTTGKLLSMTLDADREHYWDGLSRATEIVAMRLKGQLPRHRPFEQYTTRPWLRVAPWSVIQHYELWPTPFLDLTSSLRVAASFALGVHNAPTGGFLYVIAIQKVVSDVMRQIGVDTDLTVVRLSSVCPPGTQRPHLQEGHLIGNPNFKTEDLGQMPVSPIVDRMVAKFHVLDSPPGFWDPVDFPRHSWVSMLPDDETSESLKSAMAYFMKNGRLQLGA